MVFQYFIFVIELTKITNWHSNLNEKEGREGGEETRITNNIQNYSHAKIVNQIKKAFMAKSIK